MRQLSSLNLCPEPRGYVCPIPLARTDAIERQYTQTRLCTHTFVTRRVDRARIHGRGLRGFSHTHGPTRRSTCDRWTRRRRTERRKRTAATKQTHPCNWQIDRLIQSRPMLLRLSFSFRFPRLMCIAASMKRTLLVRPHDSTSVQHHCAGGIVAVNRMKWREKIYFNYG